MGIEPNFDIDAIFKSVQEKVNVIAIGVQEAMIKTCLEVTSNAKQLNTYIDRTNNLRSSIGYIIYDKGEKIAEHFSADGAGGEGSGSEGTTKGKQAAEKAANDFPNDLVGVIVAGEGYALYVESKGYDVLSGPFLEAYPILEKNLRLIFD